MNRKGSTTSIIIATVAGLAVLGVAGYRAVSGDCSSCAITGLITGGSATTVAAPVADITPVAAEGDSCCALKAGTESEATLVATEAGASCDSASKAACETACSGEAQEVQTVSTEGEACGMTYSGEVAPCGAEKETQELAKAPQ